MITIGTDPEFLLIDRSGYINSASNFEFFNSCSSSSEIGRDGAGTPVEIRPRPSFITEVDLLTDNIERILRKVARYCHPKRLKLFAGANYNGRKPIGGHIHFGSPELRRGRDREKLIHVLDTHFTPIMNHFIEATHLQGRLNDGYGRLSSFETKNYGFEYRTPYSFLMSPFLTKAGFSLASLLAYHYKKIPYDYDLYNDCYDYSKHLTDLTRRKNLYDIVKPKILRLMSYKSINKQNNPNIISMFNLIERGKMCGKNVFKNYKMESTNDFDFEVIWSGDDLIQSIRSAVRGHLENKGKGEVYVYGVKRRKARTEVDYDTGETYTKRTEIPETLEPTLFLSEGMPKPRYLRKCKVMYKVFGEGSNHRNSIGLSFSLRNEIIKGKRNISFLAKYLNSLNFKKQAELF